MIHEFLEILSKFYSVEELIDSFHQLLKEPLTQRSRIVPV